MERAVNVPCQNYHHIDQTRQRYHPLHSEEWIRRESEDVVQIIWPWKPIEFETILELLLAWQWCRFKERREGFPWRKWNHHWKIKARRRLRQRSVCRFQKADDRERPRGNGHERWLHIPSLSVILLIQGWNIKRLEKEKEIHIRREWERRPTEISKYVFIEAQDQRHTPCYRLSVLWCPISRNKKSNGKMEHYCFFYIFCFTLIYYN